MKDAPFRWLLLLLSVPGQQAALRMRTWRRLKSAGAGVLRDGAYVMPDAEPWRDVLAAVADEVRVVGGDARLLPVEAPRAEFAPLFDRSADYAALLAAVADAAARIGKRPAARARERFQQLQREFDLLVAADPLPGSAQAQARAAMDALRERVDLAEGLGEPVTVSGRIALQDRRRFRGRTWATRRRLGIDRLASAWLISRFIDPDATFRWLAPPGRQRPEFVGFDFDGATFTHVGGHVTFEVLLQAFSLGRESVLQRIAALVHYLDVGGVPVPEASAVDLLLAGLQQRCADDDALLAAALQLFDDLHAGIHARQGTA